METAYCWKQPSRSRVLVEPYSHHGPLKPLDRLTVPLPHASLCPMCLTLCPWCLPCVQGFFPYAQGVFSSAQGVIPYTQGYLSLCTRCLSLCPRFLPLCPRCLTLCPRCLPLCQMCLRLYPRCLPLCAWCLPLCSRFLSLCPRCLPYAQGLCPYAQGIFPNLKVSLTSCVHLLAERPFHILTGTKPSLTFLFRPLYRLIWGKYINFLVIKPPMNLSSPKFWFRSIVSIFHLRVPRYSYNLSLECKWL